MTTNFLKTVEQQEKQAKAAKRMNKNKPFGGILAQKEPPSREQYTKEYEDYLKRSAQGATLGKGLKLLFDVVGAKKGAPVSAPTGDRTAQAYMDALAQSRRATGEHQRLSFNERMKAIQAKAEQQAAQEAKEKREDLLLKEQRQYKTGAATTKFERQKELATHRATTKQSQKNKEGKKKVIEMSSGRKEELEPETYSRYIGEFEKTSYDELRDKYPSLFITKKDSEDKEYWSLKRLDDDTIVRIMLEEDLKRKAQEEARMQKEAVRQQRQIETERAFLKDLETGGIDNVREARKDKFPFSLLKNRQQQNQQTQNRQRAPWDLFQK